jgi:hypothetical protein
MKKCVGEENDMKPQLTPIAKSWEATLVFGIDVVFFFRCRFKQVTIGSEYCLCMRKISFRDTYLEVLRQIREV